MQTGDCPRNPLKVIAEQLRLSEHTVKFHVRNLLDKLDVTSRGEAAALARDLRLEPVTRPLGLNPA